MVEVAIVFEIEQVVGIILLVITVGIGACVLDIDPRQPRLLVTILDGLSNNRSTDLPLPNCAPRISWRTKSTSRWNLGVLVAMA